MIRHCCLKAMVTISEQMRTAAFAPQLSCVCMIENSKMIGASNAYTNIYEMYSIWYVDFASTNVAYVKVIRRYL